MINSIFLLLVIKIIIFEDMKEVDSEESGAAGSIGTELSEHICSRLDLPSLHYDCKTYLYLVLIVLRWRSWLFEDFPEKLLIDWCIQDIADWESFYCWNSWKAPNLRFCPKIHKESDRPNYIFFCWLGYLPTIPWLSNEENCYIYHQIVWGSSSLCVFEFFCLLHALYRLSRYLQEFLQPILLAQ